MRCLAFFLSFELPEINLTGAKQNVIRLPLKEEGRQNVVWTVANLVNNSLYWLVGFDVPNLHHLVCSQ